MRNNWWINLSWIIIQRLLYRYPTYNQYYPLTMKYAKYISTIPVEEKHTLLYNALSGKFVVIRNKVFDDIKTLPFELLASDFPTVYKQCVEAGIIVDDALDEVALLEERIKQADNNSDNFILHINPTLDCNFNCWYCYENHVPHSRMKEDMVVATKSFIGSVLKGPEIKSFSLVFFGGEPLFHFDKVSKEIIGHAAAECAKSGVRFHVNFTSNGALITEDIVKFLSQYPCGFQITLDGGKPYHDKTRFGKNGVGSFDTIVKNIKLLLQTGINVIVRINYTAANIDSVLTVFDSFKNISEAEKKFARFDFQRVWQDRNDNVFDDTEKKITWIRNIFRDAGFAVITNYILQGVVQSCYGDKINHLLVNYNGDVYGCTARDFNKENRIGYIDLSGVVHFDKQKLEIRNNSKLSKAICKSCRIAPLCCGGCKQRAMEGLSFESCTFGYSEEKKDRIILDIFEHSFMQR